jgi:hypothetical protein
MRRIAPALIVLALAVAAPAAAAASPSPTGVELDACHTGTSWTDTGYATFGGDMRSISRTDQMAMRFDLYMREPGDTRFRRVQAPRLGIWDRSRSGVGRFIYTKTVTNLLGPADYRTVVHFRWYDAGGAIIRRARRTTDSCTQPDLRPNLTRGAPSALAGPQPGLWRYTIPVRNTGRTDAGPFDVALRVGATDPAVVAVSALRAGDAQTVTFLAPPCALGDRLRYEADSDDRIAESDERDNVVRVDCPG